MEKKLQKRENDGLNYLYSQGKNQIFFLKKLRSKASNLKTYLGYKNSFLERESHWICNSLRGEAPSKRESGLQWTFSLFRGGKKGKHANARERERIYFGILCIKVHPFFTFRAPPCFFEFLFLIRIQTERKPRAYLNYCRWVGPPGKRRKRRAVGGPHKIGRNQ